MTPEIQFLLGCFVGLLGGSAIGFILVAGIFKWLGRRAA